LGQKYGEGGRKKKEKFSAVPQMEGKKEKKGKRPSSSQGNGGKRRKKVRRCLAKLKGERKWGKIGGGPQGKGEGGERKRGEEKACRNRRDNGEGGKKGTASLCSPSPRRREDKSGKQAPSAKVRQTQEVRKGGGKKSTSRGEKKKSFNLKAHQKNGLACWGGGPTACLSRGGRLGSKRQKSPNLPNGWEKKRPKSHCRSS